MRIRARFVFHMEDEKAQRLFKQIGKKLVENSPPDTIRVIETYKDTTEYETIIQELKKMGIITEPDEDEVFSKQELFEAPILRIVPNAHRGGYPQPENGGREENYQAASFDLNTGCEYCTNGRFQNRPLRLKSSIKMGNMDISGVWWLRELIVSVKLRKLIEDAGLTGCEFWPVIRHRENEPFEEIFQLKITGGLPAMSSETGITHRTEWLYKGERMRSCHNGCGERIIRGPVIYDSIELLDITDFSLTQEWFGSNNEYWRWPFLSHKAYQLFLDNKIKGVRFYPPIIK